jgi:hypothetical protein
MLRACNTRVVTLIVPFAVACGSVQTAPDPAPLDGSASAPDTGALGDGGSVVPVDAAPFDGGRLDASSLDAGAPPVCGSRGSPPCPRGTFCFRPDSCGEADEGGTCIAPPGACPRILAPVCGCDGRTYENACEAQRAQVSVRSTGACVRVDASVPPIDAAVPPIDAALPPRDGGAGGAGAPCGGFVGLSCGPGLFCLEPRGQCVTVADGTGTCTARPGICPGLYSPVCGCDRVTYSNECAAHAAGRSVASAGACP